MVVMTTIIIIITNKLTTTRILHIQTDESNICLRRGGCFEEETEKKSESILEFSIVSDCVFDTGVHYLLVCICVCMYDVYVCMFLFMMFHAHSGFLGHLTELTI